MVVSSSGKKGLRSFEVVRVVNHEGCETKFNKNSRLVGRNPAGAARKVLSNLCSRKDTRNRCTFVICVRETTQGSNHKEYMYKCKREKLAKPLVIKRGKEEVKIMFRTTSKSTKTVPKCKGRSKKGKSSGPMKKKGSKRG